MTANRGEPGSRARPEGQDPSWDVYCPIVYCSAWPNNPCMNRSGRFAKTHIKRREASYIKQKRNGTENDLLDL